MTTISNLIFWLLPDIFIPYLSTKFSSITYSRAVVAPTFPLKPSIILGESPGQSRELLEWMPRENEYNFF